MREDAGKVKVEVKNEYGECSYEVKIIVIGKPVISKPFFPQILDKVSFISVYIFSSTLSSTQPGTG